MSEGLRICQKTDHVLRKTDLDSRDKCGFMHFCSETVHEITKPIICPTYPKTELIWIGWTGKKTEIRLGCGNIVSLITGEAMTLSAPAIQYIINLNSV